MISPPQDTVTVAKATADTLLAQTAQGAGPSVLELVGMILGAIGTVLGAIGTVGVAVLGWLRYKQESSTHEDVFYKKRMEATEDIVSDMQAILVQTMKVHGATGGDLEKETQELLDLYYNFGNRMALSSLYLPQEVAVRVGNFQDAVQKAVDDPDKTLEYTEEMEEAIFAIVTIARREQGLPDLTERISERFS